MTYLSALDLSRSTTGWGLCLTPIGAGGLALCLTPWVRAAAQLLGYLDAPDARKVHYQPVVRLGGVAISVATLVSVAIALLLLPIETARPLLGVLGGSLGFFLIGLADDLIGLSPYSRLVLQGLVAAGSWSLGVRIDVISLLGPGAISLGLLSLPISVVWMTGVVNAINWIDGLDGLAAGISTIAALVLFVLCLPFGALGEEVIFLALIGSLMGFLRYNFNPAQIFMGDGGSYFIGFLLSSMSVTALTAQSSDHPSALAIALPLLVLGVPLGDMVFVIAARLWRGQSPFEADRGHVHHRLMAAGLTHRQTVLFLYGATLWLGGLALTGINVWGGVMGMAIGLGAMGGQLWHSRHAVLWRDDLSASR